MRVFFTLVTVIVAASVTRPCSFVAQAVGLYRRYREAGVPAKNFNHSIYHHFLRIPCDLVKDYANSVTTKILRFLKSA